MTGTVTGTTTQATVTGTAARQKTGLSGIDELSKVYAGAQLKEEKAAKSGLEAAWERFDTAARLRKTGATLDALVTAIKSVGGRTNSTALSEEGRVARLFDVKTRVTALSPDFYRRLLKEALPLRDTDEAKAVQLVREWIAVRKKQKKDRTQGEFLREQVAIEEKKLADAATQGQDEPEEHGAPSFNPSSFAEDVRVNVRAVVEEVLPDEERQIWLEDLGELLGGLDADDVAALERGLKKGAV